MQMRLRRHLLVSALCTASCQLAWAVRHIVAKQPALVSTVLCAELDMAGPDTLALIALGAVYVRSEVDSRARRLTADEMVEERTYLRVHPVPKRFPADEVDWRDIVLSETADYVVIDKPRLIPSCPTTDNAHENVVASLATALQLPRLYLPHRLDVETSGLMVLAKNKQFTADLCQQFKERRVNKFYRALLLSSAPVPRPFTAGESLVHYMDKSERSPRVFRNAPIDSSLLCESEVAEASPVLRASSEEWHARAAASPDKLLRAAADNWFGSADPLTQLSLQEVELCLKTGRTHQCRGQLGSGDWRVAGDNSYGPSARSELTDDSARAPPSTFLALQACRLDFYYGSSQIQHSLDKSWWRNALS